MPMTPMNYQLPSMFNLPSVPIQYNLNHPLYRHLLLQQAQQAMRLNSSPNSVDNGSVCTALDESYPTFEGRNSYFRGLNADVTDALLKKEEYIPKKEESSIGDSSPEEAQRLMKIEAKIEFKMEEKTFGKKLQKARQTKQSRKKSFDEDDDDDDFDEKLEAWDDDRTSDGPDSHITDLSGNPKVNLRVQLKEMVEFIIAHFGRIREEDLLRERLKYQHSPILSQVFEVLNSKYSCTFKTRAEIVKYITRKAFSTIKNNSKKESDSSSREACKALCKRYFQVSSEEIQSSGVDIENRERFLQLLFPYQKNSKNKLQDIDLISKLMSSKEFYQDYCLYVQDLETILEADNNRKLSKFITFILNCVSKGQIQNIMKYKRVPWLKAWLDNTKMVARELAFNIQWKSQQKSDKTIKKEKSCQSVQNLCHETNRGAGVNQVWLQ